MDVWMEMDLLIGKAEQAARSSGTEHSAEYLLLKAIALGTAELVRRSGK